ncbi:MAG TPA: diguanylate cyclase [Kofleriaceae bacterium]|nr:diguanylate cyclase [Kofleriaceae bacterium]
MGKRLGVFDPTGRLIEDLAAAAQGSHAELEAFDPANGVNGIAGLLLTPAVAAELGPPADGAPPRWIVGDAANAARIAGAAASAGAAGVLLAPVVGSCLDAVAHGDPTSVEFELARARGLIATSLVDLTGAAAETLRAVAEGFTAHDCIVWWKDGAQMVPTAARPAPTDSYRTQVAGAARIAAASGGTVIFCDDEPRPRVTDPSESTSAATRSVIADALRSSPTEIAGLVAIVSDSGRRFSAAERTDLKAIAARLTRELSWLTSHRRLVAEGERLLAASLHDPLSGAMTRGAFEQTITHEVAAAGRRNETLTLAVFDVVGLRRINLAHGHRAGDEVLAQVAARLRATVRGNDPMGRLGGDELAVLLVGANSDQAVLVARKLIHRIQSEAIKCDDLEVAVQLRCVLTELAPGERSGEAALSRCYGSLRTAPVGDVRVVSIADRNASDAEQGADTGALSAGTIVGGTYRVVHELSRGAMGVVYRGEDLGLGRPVAIKVLRSDLASDRDLVDRFRAEAAILASLHHKNLVQVYALGEHAGEVYFVMELVEGQPLSEVLRATLERREWFPIEAITQITLEIGDALDAMHVLGLIHRDVKPANILLDRERDRAVLVDVGVAVKAGNQSDAAGTPGFAAPESFLEQEGGPQTDVYGLAATMYCAITGRPPFGSGPAPQVVQRQINDVLAPPSQLRAGISGAVDAVLGKALSPNPKKRWASASTFAIALGRALERGSAAEIRLPPVEENVAVAAAEAVMRPTAGIEIAAAIERVSTIPGKVPGRVRAAHLRVLTRILQHHVGESGMAKLRAQHPGLANALAPTLAPLAWVELHELVSALSFGGDLLASAGLPRKVGRGTMSATFARLLGADPGSLAPETVLAALPTFWARYHDWGAVEVTVDQNSATVVLAGDSGSADVCAMVGSELERMIELTGTEPVAAAHPSCRYHKAQRCEFRVTWAR